MKHLVFFLSVPAFLLALGALIPRWFSSGLEDLAEQEQEAGWQALSLASNACFDNPLSRLFIFKLSLENLSLSEEAGTENPVIPAPREQHYAALQRRAAPPLRYSATVKARSFFGFPSQTITIHDNAAVTCFRD